MRRRISGMALLCAICLAVTTWAAWTAPALGQEAAVDVDLAQRYLRSALEAEVRGQPDERAALLQRALRAAPDHAPTRWQLAQVRVKGRWLPLEEVRRQMAGDDLLLRYQALRDECAGQPEGELTLARWCRGQNLDEEARAHWVQVLLADPNNMEAARALAMRWFRGRLLPDAQIDEIKEEMRQANRDMKQWKPAMLRWRNAIKSGSADECTDALRQLYAVDEPSAVASLEAVFSDQRSNRRNGDMSREAVAVLGRIDDPAATWSLVRHAVLSPWEDVRMAAADHLSRKPLHAYVPQLISRLASPVEVTTYTHVYPGTSVVAGIALFQEGIWEDQLVSIGLATRSTPVRASRNSPELALARNSLVRATARAALGADAASARLKAQIDEGNARIRATNLRIDAALRRATGVEMQGEPDSWRSWWNDYNELYVPLFKRVRYKNRLSYWEIPIAIPRPYGTSCFDRGTPVWTLTGRIPIEQVKIGDRVLSQNPQTGELAYKPVLGTTVRPPSEMTAITIEGERIRATAGHPMWVAGRGWRMVKNLSTEMSLHGLNGSLPIEELADDGRREAFNLVVADFNTYFVGQHGLLAHDNTLRGPVSLWLPGLPAERQEP